MHVLLHAVYEIMDILLYMFYNVLIVIFVFVYMYKLIVLIIFIIQIFFMIPFPAIHDNCRKLEIIWTKIKLLS